MFYQNRPDGVGVQLGRATRSRVFDCAWSVAATCWLVALATLPSAAADPQTAGARPDARALVARLGDRSFAVRESATTQLAQMDISVRPLLEEALKSRDAEVRTRARQILAIVNERFFEQRLAAFAADVDGKQALEMPGWARYKQIVGHSAAARELFVTMQRAESKLLRPPNPNRPRSASC
jgi:HEAT repeat protein